MTAGITRSRPPIVPSMPSDEKTHIDTIKRKIERWQSITDLSSWASERKDIVASLQPRDTLTYITEDEAFADAAQAIGTIFSDLIGTQPTPIRILEVGARKAFTSVELQSILKFRGIGQFFSFEACDIDEDYGNQPDMTFFPVKLQSANDAIEEIDPNVLVFASQDSFVRPWDAVALNRFDGDIVVALRTSDHNTDCASEPFLEQITDETQWETLWKDPIEHGRLEDVSRICRRVK